MGVSSFPSNAMRRVRVALFGRAGLPASCIDSVVTKPCLRLRQTSLVEPLADIVDPLRKVISGRQHVKRAKNLDLLELILAVVQTDGHMTERADGNERRYFRSDGRQMTNPPFQFEGQMNRCRQGAIERFR